MKKPAHGRFFLCLELVNAGCPSGIYRYISVVRLLSAPQALGKPSSLWSGHEQEGIECLSADELQTRDRFFHTELKGGAANNIME
jgi:hypothetical protein